MNQGRLFIYFTLSNHFENLSILEYKCDLLTQLLLSCHCLSTFFQPDTTQLRALLAVVYECSQLPSFFPRSQGPDSCCAWIYDAACLRTVAREQVGRFPKSVASALGFLI